MHPATTTTTALTDFHDSENNRTEIINDRKRDQTRQVVLCPRVRLSCADGQHFLRRLELLLGACPQVARLIRSSTGAAAID